jgi:hypothetical protein
MFPCFLIPAKLPLNLPRSTDKNLQFLMVSSASTKSGGFNQGQEFFIKADHSASGFSGQPRLNLEDLVKARLLK